MENRVTGDPFFFNPDSIPQHRTHTQQTLLNRCHVKERLRPCNSNTLTAEKLMFSTEPLLFPHFLHVWIQRLQRALYVLSLRTVCPGLLAPRWKGSYLISSRTLPCWDAGMHIQWGAVGWQGAGSLIHNDFPRLKHAFCPEPFFPETL